MKKLSILIIIIFCGAIAASAQSKKYNVLFIVIDDMKPDLGCYGFNAVKSPNIDALAKTATLFTSAYCQQAICGPTRASVLTGVSPDKTKVWEEKMQIREANPDIVTLPQYFKENGYTTLGMGKVFDASTVKKNDEISWSVPYKTKFPLAKGYEDIAFDIYQDPKIKAIVKQENNTGKSEESFWGRGKNMNIRYSTECLDVPDDAYMDGAMANYAVKQLSNLKNESKPFFMAVGFKKPHLPFIAPKKYWDLYDQSKMPLAKWQEKSVDGPDIAYHNSGEMRNYAMDIVPLNDDKAGLLRLPESKQRQLINGYFACISYIDAQVGKLMAALKASGLDKNTIVILWGDHGWHLGDHSLWNKHTNFEEATHTAMMLKVPGVTNGAKHNGFVQFLDIYPTLCDLTGLKIGNYLEGKSLVPALKNNNQKIRDYAISQYPRALNGNRFGAMGYTIRDKQYRYTEWMGDEFNTSKPFDESKVLATELYDYKNDPLETKNKVKESELKNVVKGLSEKLHAYYAQQYKTAGKISD